MCGGTAKRNTSISKRNGLSPRVRGNLSFEPDCPYLHGTIPACAGEPTSYLALRSFSRDYPRVCGGTTPTSAPTFWPRGLSPRVRGNRWLWLLPAGTPRTIPACAGEPLELVKDDDRSTDYPRVCGGTLCRGQLVDGRHGLSPRVRGNRNQLAHIVLVARTIPACAGEPCPQCHRRRKRWDYPRVCGGTVVRCRQMASSRGLSPRVRGNPKYRRPGEGPERTIPACAGEPGMSTGGRSIVADYPRVCGGTRIPPAPSIPRPRTIPACAGEPFMIMPASAPTWDYPRVCGGTTARARPKPSLPGLSPRVRGNPRRPFLVPASARTIPACAGEPPVAPPSSGRGQDYPRVCGGTRYTAGYVVRCLGLSPRVRGNLAGPPVSQDAGRTIPACAGEPQEFGVTADGTRDYPRVCGGTTVRAHR